MFCSKSLYSTEYTSRLGGSAVADLDMSCVATDKIRIFTCLFGSSGDHECFLLTSVLALSIADVASSSALPRMDSNLRPSVLRAQCGSHQTRKSIWCMRQNKHACISYTACRKCCARTGAVAMIHCLHHVWVCTQYTVGCGVHTMLEVLNLVHCDMNPWRWLITQTIVYVRI